VAKQFDNQNCGGRNFTVCRGLGGNKSDLETLQHNGKDCTWDLLDRTMSQETTDNSTVENVVILYCSTPEPVSLPVFVLYKNAKMFWNRNQMMNKVYMQFFLLMGFLPAMCPIFLTSYVSHLCYRLVWLSELHKAI
jgi:hypothetical protein